MQNVPFSYMPERKRDIYSYLQYDLTTNLAWYPWKATGGITHVNKTVCDTEKQLSIFIRYCDWTSIIMILQYVSSIQDFWGVLQHALFISTWLFDEIYDFLPFTFWCLRLKLHFFNCLTTKKIIWRWLLYCTLSIYHLKIAIKIFW